MTTIHEGLFHNSYSYKPVFPESILYISHSTGAITLQLYCWIYQSWPRLPATRSYVMPLAFLRRRYQCCSRQLHHQHRGLNRMDSVARYQSQRGCFDDRVFHRQASLALVALRALPLSLSHLVSLIHSRSLFLSLLLFIAHSHSFLLSLSSSLFIFFVQTL